MVKYIILVLYISAMITGAISTHFIDIAGEYRAELSQSNRVVSYLENRYTPPASYPYINPVHIDDFKKLTSPYGLREIPRAIYTGGAVNRDHAGIDISGTWRARILAIADGEVIDKWFPPVDGKGGHPIYGGMIRVLQDDGRIVLYAHLSATYVNETDNRFIKQGQVIGRMGNTGISAGQHLHIEVHGPDGEEQPLKLIEGLE